jgi:hypothetical protein
MGRPILKDYRPGPVRPATVAVAAALLIWAAVSAQAGARVWAGGACSLDEAYLNQLMMAESGGRLDARNPRSSALGPYQFIRSTFLEVTGRHFAGEVSALSRSQVLALRTDFKFSRRIAEAYSRENAAYLRQRGHKASPANLRLAFFAGAAGATRIITADPQTPVASLLGPTAVSANPFLNRMTAKALIERSARDMRLTGTFDLYPGRPAAPVTKYPQIDVRCNLKRASCRKWLFLAKKRLERKLAGKPPARIASVMAR